MTQTAPGTARDPSGTGLCVVRIETDASAGLLITVTVRTDVDDPDTESVLRTAAVEIALGRVAVFLRGFARHDR
jgi:hypothetical protein